MVSYVDGFLLAVQKKKLGAYKKMAMEGGKVWKKFGALEYFECVGEDLNPKMSIETKCKTFPQNLRLKKGETAVFSFIVYKSRPHRDAVNKKVMAAMEKKYANAPKDMKMPFDVKRMVYGGFRTLVEC